MARNQSEKMPVAQGATHLLFHARNHEEDTELALLVPWDQACADICVRSWNLLDQIRKNDPHIVSIKRRFGEPRAFECGGALSRWLEDTGRYDSFIDGICLLESPPPIDSLDTWGAVSTYGSNLIIGHGWAWWETDCDGIFTCDEGIGRTNDVLFGR